MNNHRVRLPISLNQDANPVKQQQNQQHETSGLVVARPNVNTQHSTRVPRSVPISQFSKLYLSTAHDPQYVFQYSEDIYRTLRESEQKYLIRRDYMEQQPRITARFREVLIDWLSSVRGKYGLKPETFALAVSLLDRYLELRQIEKNLLQLLGCTCLWVASKYEEIYPPELQDLVQICENNFKRESFIMMERNVLTLLDFSITVPYAIHFADRYIQALPPNFDTSLVIPLTQYLIESTYQHYYFISKLPSAIGAAAVSLALFFTKQPHWHGNLTTASEYIFDQIRPLFAVIWQYSSDVSAHHFAKKEAQHNQDQARQHFARQGISDPSPDQLPKIPKAFDSVLRLHSTEPLSYAPQYATPYDPNLIPVSDAFFGIDQGSY